MLNTDRATVDDITLNGKEPTPDQHYAYDWTSNAPPRIAPQKAQKEGANKRDHRDQSTDIRGSGPFSGFKAHDVKRGEPAMVLAFDTRSRARSF